jgi:hypothetical protein
MEALAGSTSLEMAVLESVLLIAIAAGVNGVVLVSSYLRPGPRQALFVYRQF